MILSIKLFIMKNELLEQIKEIAPKLLNLERTMDTKKSTLSYFS